VSVDRIIVATESVLQHASGGSVIRIPTLLLKRVEEKTRGEQEEVQVRRRAGQEEEQV